MIGRARTFVVQVLGDDGLVAGWLGRDDDVVGARWRAREIPHLASAEWIALTNPATRDRLTRVVEVKDVEIDLRAS